jgi:hypothetical protein
MANDDDTVDGFYSRQRRDLARNEKYHVRRISCLGSGLAYFFFVVS